MLGEEKCEGPPPHALGRMGGEVTLFPDCLERTRVFVPQEHPLDSASTWDFRENRFYPSASQPPPSPCQPGQGPGCCGAPPPRPSRPDLCSARLLEIQVMMGSLVYLRLGLEKSPYCHLLDNSHWAEICETFTRDACSLLGLSVESPLSVRYGQPCGGSASGRVSRKTVCRGRSCARDGTWFSQT